jgi:hypothetical protein
VRALVRTLSADRCGDAGILIKKGNGRGRGAPDRDDGGSPRAVRTVIAMPAACGTGRRQAEQ